MAYYTKRREPFIEKLPFRYDGDNFALWTVKPLSKEEIIEAGETFFYPEPEEKQLSFDIP